MKKLFYLIPALLLAGILFYACQEPITQPDDPLSSSDQLYSVIIEGACGTTTWDLTAGQTNVVGNVTVENDEDNIYITYTLDILNYPDACFGTLHAWVGSDLNDLPGNGANRPPPGQLCSLPGGECFNTNGGTSHTFTIPFSDLGITDVNTVCNQNVFVVTHAEVDMDCDPLTMENNETAFGGPNEGPGSSWWFYGDYAICCDFPPGPEPEPECETAYAFGGDEEDCFINNGFNNWGWTNGPLTAGTYDFDIYAGAGQCDISKGELVGTLTVAYDGATATVTYNMNAGFTMSEVHLYVGNAQFPLDNNGNPTVAPGKYPVGEEFDEPQTTFTKTFNVSGEIYVIAHAVVCTALPCDPLEITTLYGTIGTNPGYLVTVDPVTGDATEVAPFDFTGTTPTVGVVFDLAFDATTGKLYGLGRFANVPSPTRTPALVEICPATASVILVGAVTIPGATVWFGEGFAISPDGEAYVSLSLNGDVNPDYCTAVATTVGTISPTVQTEADALGFVGTTLYASDSNGNVYSDIYTLNTSTAAATHKGTLSSPRIDNLSDFAWNSNTNLLYGFDPGANQTGSPRNLCTISQPGTAEATLIGVTHSSSEFGGGFMYGLAWGNSGCCE
jgi:hypothetical protein